MISSPLIPDAARNDRHSDARNPAAVRESPGTYSTSGDKDTIFM